jgi:hypothetical protein
MNPYQLLFSLVTTLALAFACWLVFWTNSAVRFAQSRPVSRHPNPAFEPWYPTWVRFEGLWMFVMIVFLLSLKFTN